MAQKASSTDKPSGPSATAHDLDAVAEQLDTLKRDVSTLVDTVGGLVGNTARRGRVNARRKADEYVRRGRATVDAAVDQAYGLEEELETQISRNPLTAVLVALGLGFVIGLVSRR